MRAATGPKTEQLKLFAELPPTSGALVARVLAVDPAIRYQTAAEFATAVAPHIAGGKAEAAELMQRLFGEDFTRARALWFIAGPGEGPAPPPRSKRAGPRSARPRSRPASPSRR